MRRTPIVSALLIALVVACGGVDAPLPTDVEEPVRPEPDLPPAPDLTLDEEGLDAGGSAGGPADAGTDPSDAGVIEPPDAGSSDGGGDGGIDGGSDAGSPAPTVLAPGVTARVTAPDFLNLRNGPSSTAAILEEMACGASVTVVSGPSGRWWEVVHSGRQGWASGVYLVPDALFDPSVCPAAPPPGGGGTGGSIVPPASLVQALSARPYVEGSCSATTFTGWPHAAKRCTYGGGLQVTVANPSPERVARWIVDSAQMIPALAGLEGRDRANWEAGLKVIAANTMSQSSRIFPLAGLVREGTINYRFDRGVTAGCSTGCYCRINSTTRREWCRYRAQVLRSGSESACLSLYSTTTFTDAWARHCLDNHAASWDADENPHYRARAYGAQLAIGGQFPRPATADGGAVVRALKGYFVVY